MRAVHVIDTVTGGAVEREPGHEKLDPKPAGKSPLIVT